jgi:hypothetical protein
VAQRLNNEESKKWNKTQADTLRRLADQVEQGDYESLQFNTDIDYMHFVTSRTAVPQRMAVHFELKYVEGEVTHATIEGAFGEGKEKD